MCTNAPKSIRLCFYVVVYAQPDLLQDTYTPNYETRLTNEYPYSIDSKPHLAPS